MADDWMKYVKWPTCSECRSSGIRIDQKTQWPEECIRCKDGRKTAVAAAKRVRTRERKEGRA